VIGDADLEMLAMALEGVSLVTLGEVSARMRLLDESGTAAVGGAIRDVDAHLTACCYLILACERARDHGRAALASPARPPAVVAGLTSRELDVLGLLAAGHSNEEIARRLVLSVRTVERHVSNIYLKIGVSGRIARAAAAAYAHRNGLVPMGHPFVG
jgi:DNA-binding NarL/FixJ family response regulator